MSQYNPPLPERSLRTRGPFLVKATASTARRTVVFDFDGTLTATDSLPRFLVHAVGRGAYRRALARSGALLAGYLCGIVRNDRAKGHLLRSCLGHLTRARIEELGRGFAARDCDALLRPAMRAELEAALRSGAAVLLVSASLDVYLRPWAERWGLADCLCTRLAYDALGRPSGAFDGGNCHGAEKARRLAAWLREHPACRLVVHGDSRGDHAMMEMADECTMKGKPWIPPRRR